LGAAATITGNFTVTGDFAVTGTSTFTGAAEVTGQLTAPTVSGRDSDLGINVTSRLTVSGNLGVNLVSGVVSTDLTASNAKRALDVYDSDGVLLGYIPIYETVA
jgi:hypothetical protein